MDFTVNQGMVVILRAYQAMGIAHVCCLKAVNITAIPQQTG